MQIVLVAGLWLATGTYHNLGLFFDRISKLSRIINVSSVSIRALEPPELNRTVAGECIATTFVLLETPPPVATPLDSGPPEEVGGLPRLRKLEDLEHYLPLGRKVLDQAQRRILYGEEVPATEKLYSIFEEHTELLKRGKARKPIDGPAGKLGIERQEYFENASNEQMITWIKEKNKTDKPFFIYWASYALQITGSKAHQNDPHVDRPNGGWFPVGAIHVGSLVSLPGVEPSVPR